VRFVTRETWDAIVPRSQLRPLKDAKVKGIVVHHTTGSAIEPERMIGAHDRYHKYTRGWSGGLAYNWLVSGDGRIWEGRGWNQGGATKNWNDRSVAVAYLGDSNHQLPQDAKAALVTVFDAVHAKYGRDLWIKVHSDFKATDCPGSELRDWVQDEASALLSKGVSEASERPTTVDEWDALIKFLQGLRAAVRASPLKRWRRNNQYAVMAVQNALNTKGFQAGKVDGKYGRRTKYAVVSFQATQFLPRNGVVAVGTWDALFPA